MNNIFDKFSIYEQIAYFLVGGFACLLIYLDFELLKITVPKLLNEIFFILAVSYFLGHLTHAVCNLIFKDNRDNFNEKEQLLLDEIKEKYLTKEANNKSAFDILFLHSLHLDKIGQVNSFNANFGLYRGWSLILYIEAVFFLIQIIWLYSINKSLEQIFVIGFFISIVTAFLMHKRSKRFYYYLRRKTFNIYILNRIAK